MWVRWQCRSYKYISQFVNSSEKRLHKSYCSFRLHPVPGGFHLCMLTTLYSSLVSSFLLPIFQRMQFNYSFLFLSRSKLSQGHHQFFLITSKVHLHTFCGNLNFKRFLIRRNTIFLAGSFISRKETCNLSARFQLVLILFSAIIFIYFSRKIYQQDVKLFLSLHWFIITSEIHVWRLQVNFIMNLVIFIIICKYFNKII